MGAPEIILIVLMAIGWAAHLFNHGKLRGTYNVWFHTIDVMIVAALLWWGGFWL